MKPAYRSILYGAIAAVSLLVATQANATPMVLTLTATDVNNAANDSTLVFCDTASAACTAAGGTVSNGGLGPNNIIVAAGVQGGLTFTGEISSSSVGLLTGQLDTSATTVKNASSDTYVLTASLVGMNFNGPAAQVSLSGSGTLGTINGAAGSFAALTYNWFDDPSDSATPGGGQKVGTYTNPAFISSSHSFSYNFDGPLAMPDTGPLYAMSETWTYTLGPNEELLSRGLTETKTAPEPASLFILGAGPAGLGMTRRRRRS